MFVENKEHHFFLTFYDRTYCNVQNQLLWFAASPEFSPHPFYYPQDTVI